jgi:hypothetical protein
MLTCVTAADVPTIVDTSIYKHTVVENAVISCDVRYICVLILYMCPHNICPHMLYIWVIIRYYFL